MLHEGGTTMRKHAHTYATLIATAALLPACSADTVDPWPADRDAGEDLISVAAKSDVDRRALPSSDDIHAEAAPLPEESPLAEAWSRSLGGLSVDYDDAIHSIATDAAGNVFVAGTFSGGMVLGGDLYDNTPDDRDLFVVKLSADDNVIWYAVLPSHGDQTLAAMRLDAEGNPVIGGSFDGTMKVGTEEVSASPEGADAFVAKLDAHDGATRWVRTWKQIGRQAVTALAIDAKDCIILGGEHADGERAAPFIRKLDRSGEPLWQLDAKGGASDYIADIEVDRAGSIYAAVTFENTLSFSDLTLTAAGGSDAAIIKLDAQGAQLWSQSFGDLADDAMTDLAVQQDGWIIAVGEHRGRLFFDGHAYMSAAGSSDVFLMQMNADGDHAALQRFGDDGQQGSPRVAVDGTGDIILTADIRDSSISFGGELLVSKGQGDIAVVKLTADGNHIWGAIYGDHDDDVALALTTYGDEILVGGAFREAITFGDTTLESGTNGVHTTYNAFVTKLSP
jgi:outer membrane protein assembly factor BamB